MSYNTTEQLKSFSGLCIINCCYVFLLKNTCYFLFFHSLVHLSADYLKSLCSYFLYTCMQSGEGSMSFLRVSGSWWAFLLGLWQTTTTSPAVAPRSTDASPPCIRGTRGLAALTAASTPPWEVRHVLVQCRMWRCPLLSCSSMQATAVCSPLLLLHAGSGSTGTYWFCAGCCGVVWCSAVSPAPACLLFQSVRHPIESPGTLANWETGLMICLLIGGEEL